MRRTLFIGDVHSCADELADLVDRAALVSGDRVFFTGDLLSRGPKPHEVLKLYRELGGQAPVGNLIVEAWRSDACVDSFLRISRESVTQTAPDSSSVKLCTLFAPASTSSNEFFAHR